MKHILFTCFLFSTTQVCFAQNWFGNNPVWTNYFTFGFAGSGVEVAKVVGDTTIDGVSAQKIVRKRTMQSGTINNDVRIVRQIGGAIWALGSDNQFHPLYDFALAVGDSVDVQKQYSTQIIRYYITAVGTMLVDGQSVRFQNIRFRQLYGPDVCRALVLEGIGAVSGACGADNYPAAVHFFLDEPDESPVDGPQWLLCTYKNDILTYHTFASVCASITPVAEVSEAQPVISPNPFQEVLRVTVSENQSIPQVRLLDITGKIMLLQKDQPPVMQLNTSQLAAGIYFLELRFFDGHSSISRVVKHN